MANRNKFLESFSSRNKSKKSFDDNFSKDSKKKKKDFSKQRMQKRERTEFDETEE